MLWTPHNACTPGRLTRTVSPLPVVVVVCVVVVVFLVVGVVMGLF